MKCHKCGILLVSALFAKIVTSLGTEEYLNLKNPICDPLIFIMNHSSFIVSI